MSQELVFDTRTESAKNWAFWLYVAHAASFLLTLGAVSVIPLILNFVKRGDAQGTFVYSHHGWQIASFLWYLVWVVVGWVLIVTVIGAIPGAIVLIGAWIWKAYRLVRGFIALGNNEPV